MTYKHGKDITRRYFGRNLLLSPFWGIILGNVSLKNGVSMVTDFNMDIETHIHLDGSRTLLPILPELHRLTYGTNKAYPFNPRIDHLGQVKKWFGNPLKGDIVKKFYLTTGVLQDVDTLFLAAKNFVEMSARNRFKYCEAIIAPQYHTFLGLTEKQVVEALIRGIKRGEMNYSEIEVNLLLGVGREVSQAEGIRLANIYADCDRDYAVGITLVCDEAKYPPEKHDAMFEMAEARGLPRACHVAEWVHDLETQRADLKRDLPQLVTNAYTAIENLKVNRAEHLRILAYDKKLLKLVIDRGIGVTMCPGSYLNTELIKDVRELRINELLDAGALVSLHSDDDLFMPFLGEVLAMCDSAYKFTPEQKLKLRVNAWKTRFGKRKPVPRDIAHLVK